jgi:hypothetical protein
MLSICAAVSEKTAKLFFSSKSFVPKKVVVSTKQVLLEKNKCCWEKTSVVGEKQSNAMKKMSVEPALKFGINLLLDQILLLSFSLASFGCPLASFGSPFLFWSSSFFFGCPLRSFWLSSSFFLPLLLGVLGKMSFFGRVAVGAFGWCYHPNENFHVFLPHRGGVCVCVFNKRKNQILEISRFKKCEIRSSK